MMIQYTGMVCISFLGGFLQAVTGFGAGIIIMLVLPNFLPMNVAPAVSNTVCAPLAWSIAANYRKSVSYRKIIIPVAIYLAASTGAIELSTIVDLSGLKVAFGCVLVLLSMYFLFFSERVQVKGTFLSALICCGISGILSGFFGIGGPLMVLYFLAVTRSKEEYLGTINGVFSITTLYQIVLRVAAGILTVAQIPMIVVGTAGILVGRVVGSRVVDKLKAEFMKKVIYIFLAFAGILTIVQAL